MLKTETQKRNIWLDLFKLVLCWLVVCIHFAGNHYAHHPLYRVAVPTFFIISGYFLYKKEDDKRLQSAKNFVKRSAAYMLFGLGFYLVYGFVICFIDKTSPSEYFTSLYFNDIVRNFLILNCNPLKDAYHLWFIIALFTVSVFHFLLVKFKKEKWYFWIVPLCIGVHLFFNGYVKYCGGDPVSLIYTRNALFFGLPMCGLGYLLAQYNFHKKKWLKFLYLALGLAFFYLQTVEGNLLELELYLSSIFSAVFLFLFFMDLKPVKADWYYTYIGKSAHFYIYIIHLAVGKRFEKLITINHIYLKCFAVFAVSLVLYEICFLMVKLVKYLYENFHKKRAKNTLKN